MVFGNTGDELRLRRRLHARSRHRREGFLRRIPDQRPGRRRRRRRAHARAGRRLEEAPAQGATRSWSASAQMLETHFKDMQDFEFTIQDGKLFMLQTRNGKRTGVAAVRFAVRDGEGEADRLEDRHHPRAGRSARPGARADLRSRRAEGRQGHRHRPARRPRRRHRARFISTPIAPSKPRAKGEKVLLVRVETSPEDLRGMIAAEGILTARGGVSSHAALVARQMGKVCVCGAAASCRSITRPRP